ncbi:MAG: hypothetical protein ACC661_07065 [Verrucomicrobiales bacterium]
MAPRSTNAPLLLVPLAAFALIAFTVTASAAAKSPSSPLSFTYKKVGDLEIKAAAEFLEQHLAK